MIDAQFSCFEGRDREALGFVRAFIGLALFVRAALLIMDPGAITGLVGAQQFYWWYSLIIVAHGAGGLLLTAGLWTRFAALAQIPILAGAVFVHRSAGLTTQGQSLELSVLVLFLLCVLLVYGPGSWSVDRGKTA